MATPAAADVGRISILKVIQLKQMLTLLPVKRPRTSPRYHGMRTAMTGEALAIMERN